MVLRLKSAKSQHKEGLTLLFFSPTYNWLLSNFLPSGSTACGSVDTRIQFMPRGFLCQPAGSSLSPLVTKCICSRTSQNPSRLATEMPWGCPTTDTGSFWPGAKTNCCDHDRQWFSWDIFLIFFFVFHSYLDFDSL